MKSVNYRLLFSKSIFLGIFFLNIVFAQAQNEKKYIKEGDAAAASGDSKTALNQYLQAYKLNQTNASLNYKIGVQYLKSEYPHKCLSYFESAYKLDPKVDKDILFNLGVAYQENHRFDEAADYFTKYRATLDPSNPFLKKIDRRLYECANGKEFMEKPVDVKIQSVSSVVNSPYSDFAPVISADEKVMIFTSRRPGSTGGSFDENGQYYEDIYISKKIAGQWGAPQNIGSNINTEFHDASIALSADGSELFIYKDDNAGDIYYCKQRADGSWSKPLPIEGSVNSRTYRENAAAVSPDGNTLFFASNREGGYGKLDLYMVKMNDKGFWGKPINLGPTINTEVDDESPFMDFDGMTLYFSSRAHKGMGGLDIFKTYYDSTKGDWTEPINMGYPINSADDDINFVLSGDGGHGYYASAKDDGVGEKDIYMISMPPREDRTKLIEKMKAMHLDAPIADVVPAPTVAAVLLPITIKGVVKDAETGKPMQTVVQLTDENGKLIAEKNVGPDGLYSFTVKNEAATSYTLSTEKEEFGFINKTFSVPGEKTSSQEITQNLALKKLAVGNVYVLRNIYFDFDKATLKSASNKELNNLLQLLKQNPEMEIEISGHTDSKGSDEYNRVLSRKRAQAVVNWLVSKGISKNRLKFEGYGESRPLASNDDELEGRELNRRTEFKILKK
ncbi:OmpA family protein [Cytophaga hutchinsonii]|uniref:Peptidoglycan-associated lipoprotein n=1 Tax=Cytophaga hutchinsonii (strain ATCC 33406 / DSM 1761 / CIP 103989 / NBRC 15051 / NCIMB 9469 / D465) TaxID=269798 RepID=A0A6N4SU33_CYTH3|nr:OmpA family protein [Cytophaga hutchinsonii]ABG59965.1 peptidoglycan-associated lipoprotein [Cytophaga hutchinsonii ATCC 33406]SFX26591.1 Tetratricopeptide repeat-containing protein [Cytophaga hutchinsonii ATCC 33406]